MTAETGSKDERVGGASRRSFLKSAAGVGVTMLAPGVVLYMAAPPAVAQLAGRPADSKVRWGLLVDLNKCPSGCDVCVTACADENGLHKADAHESQWIRKVSVRDPKTDVRREVPVMCQHCAMPACVDVCPTGASFKRADGIVLVDRHICIGCRYCMMACPYQARSFVHEPLENQRPEVPRGAGTAEACSLCVHRIDAGRMPACVEACAARAGGAMVFGDLDDPSSVIAKAIKAHRATTIRADLGLDPAVHYLSL
jgi:molybdopterin-containing oxidoreductase family iron-sulfur binding subunit